MAKQKAPMNPYDKYRARAYDAVADRNDGRIERLEDVVNELVSLGNGADVDALRRAAAWDAVKREDQLRTSPLPFGVVQPLLSGWPDAEDVFWKLGETERVRVRDAKRDDHLKHLRLTEQNEQHVIDAARQTRDRYFRLLPHYLAGAKTVAEAVAAFLEDERRRSEERALAEVTS